MKIPRLLQVTMIYRISVCKCFIFYGRNFDSRLRPISNLPLWPLSYAHFATDISYLYALVHPPFLPLRIRNLWTLSFLQVANALQIGSAPLQLMHTCHQPVTMCLNMTTSISLGDRQSRMNKTCLGICERDLTVIDTAAWLARRTRISTVAPTVGPTIGWYIHVITPSAHAQPTYPNPGYGHEGL
jgi:hypothetical protein